VAAVALLVAAAGGWALGRASGDGGGDLGSEVATDTGPSAPSPNGTGSDGTPDAIAAARAIGPLPVPTSCPLRLDDPDLLPGAARDYRGGVHEGVDFLCGEPGAEVTAVLPGRVLVAARDLEEPRPDERLDLLAEAKALGDTPPWTLQVLYGQFVVVDHGVLDGAGHVVTLYAHLDDVDPALRPGLVIDAGTRLGAVGNSGTESAGTGTAASHSYHLHWELHLDDRFLGAGAGADEVAAAYRALFGA
jgi:murein DD-endopeptidase MepM/ murein hydrolase activator NlpD